jgi:hypothetical protein
MNLYKKIIVNNWINNKKFNTYDIYLYEDDNLDDACAKIAKTINNNSRFYMWRNNESILFTFKSIIWDGYNVNPLEAKNLNSKQLNDPVIITYNYGLFSYSSVNIIYEKDFPELKNNQYYFIDKKFQSLAQLNKKDEILKQLEEVDIKPIIDTTLNIHRYELESKLTKRCELVDIFEKLNTTPIIEFIQWISDTYKIIYKLYKTNNLSKDKFINWTDVKKFTNNNCINCYSILNNGTFAKLTIKDDMHITLSYTINLRKNINWEEIDNNINDITKYCNSHLNHKLNFNQISIKANFTIEIENVSMQNLKKKISEYIDIFDILKSNKDTINLIYKRSSNYNKQGFDAHIYVKNCLYLGIEEDDIINQLVILNNFSIAEAKQLLKDEQELIFEMEQQNIKQQETMNKINTIVIIELYKNGFFINIINIPNKKELENIIYWLSKIISSSIEKGKNKATKKQIVVINSLPKYSSSPEIQSDEENLGKLLFDTSSDDEKSGGALGKEKHSYFINLLQKADKDLFLNNYARSKCQAINQPIVFTEEYKQSLIKDGNYHFDNDITYGSKKDIKNVYTCPRLWCPQSKIPLNADKYPNGKCPIEGEEPMELFFENDPKKKRYVKLIKPDENNLCVPCCFKKEPKDEELNNCKFYNDNKPEEYVIVNKDENYLVNTAPITVGRYGAIPQSLHELLFPNVKFSLCSKMLTKTDKCFVRKGILHKTTKKLKNIHNDSIISAIAHGLNFKSKEHFISDVSKKLDLIKYMSLENGNVCKAFMDNLPIIPENNKLLIIELENHLENFHLNSKINNLDKANYKLSRLLGIFKSYKKFLNYIRSNDYPSSKSPYYLYSLISSLYNVLLVIWEKQGETTSIICPYYTSFEDLIGSMELNGQILMLSKMLFKDKYYYEPIELKLKGVEGEKLISLNEYKHIKKLFSECSILKQLYNHNYAIYNNIYSLHSWSKFNNLGMKEKFIITTIIINSDLSITHFITNAGFFVIIDKISISFLPRLIIDLDIIEILFYDDIINNNININVLIRDYNIFIDKCNLLNIKYDFGTLITTTKFEYYYNLTVQKLPLTNDIIHSQIIDDLYKYQLINNNNNKKWYQLQYMIYNKILHLPDKIFNYLISLNRNDRIKQLFKELNLSKNPEKAKLRVILEEIPIITKKHVKRFLNDFIIYNKYDFLNPLIKEDNNQFIFSQIAIQNHVPSKLLIYHQSTPNNAFTTFQTKDYIYNLEVEDENIQLPMIFNGTQEKLNSKWTMHKKSTWSNMIFIKNNNYNKNFIKDFYLWLAKYLNIKTTYTDLETLAFNDIQIIFTAKDYTSVKLLLKSLFDDPYFYKLLSNAIGKKYINFNLFWDQYYTVINNNDRKLLFTNIISNVKEQLYPNDYYILAMSKILNINILIIHRSKYGANNKDMPVVRGDIEDLLLSSTFYKAPTMNYDNRPLIILYKSDDDDKTIYSLIVDKTIIPVSDKSIYIKMADIPLVIKYLITEHINAQK